MLIINFIKGKYSFDMNKKGIYILNSHELVRIIPKTNEHIQLIQHFEDSFGVRF